MPASVFVRSRNCIYLRRASLALGVVLVVAMRFQAQAAAPTPTPTPASVWDGGGTNASFGTAANWASNLLPTFDGTPQITIGTGFVSGTTLTLDGNRSVSSLLINTATAFTIASGTGGSLQLRSGNITRQGVAGMATQTIASNIVLGDPAGAAAYTGIWENSGTNLLNVTGNISEAGGARSITKTGATMLVLSGSNTFSGGLKVDAGTVRVSADVNLGASSSGVTLNGGRLDTTESFTSARSLTITGPGSQIIVASGKVLELSGVVSGNSELTVTSGAGTLILSGSGSNGTGYTAIGGNAVLSLRGTVALGSGYLFLNSGVLELGNGNLTRSLGSGAGQVSMGTSGANGFSAWGADRVVNFGGTGATVTWGSGSFLLSSGSQLLFGSSTANATLDFQNGIDLAGAARTIRVNQGVGSTPEGKISGAIIGAASASGIILDNATGSPGRLLLTNGNNSYAGDTVIKAGSLWLGANATTGTGNTVLGTSTKPVQLGNSTGAYDSSLLAAGPITIGRNIDVVSGNTGTATLGGITADVSTFSGNVILGGELGTNPKNVTLTAAVGGVVTFSGLIADPAGLTSGTSGVVTKAGAGTVTLTNANPYLGGTQVNAGTLLVNNVPTSATSGTGAGAVTVNNAGSLLGGSGSIGGATTINAGAAITGGGDGSVGTLTLRNQVTFTGLSASSLASFVVDLSGATSDRLVITGDLNLASLFDQITFQGSAGTGNYQIATYSGTLFGVFDTVTNLPSGYSLQYNPGEITLAFTPVPEPGTWAAALLVLGAMVYSQRQRFRFATTPSRRTIASERKT